MSTKKTDLTNSEKILNSDIYDLTEFVDDIKKININGVGSDKETLLVGMYGYLGYEFTSLLQNAIVVSSELANEAIPTRAKFDRNVITHALSLGVKKVAATAATMKVMLMFPEKALRNNMIDGKFTFESSTPIRFGDYEFHTDYDIDIYSTELKSSTNGTNKDYVYTAHYNMSTINPISDIDNEYLPPLSIFADNSDNMVILITTLHQVEYTEIDEKIVGSDDINNKTLSFTFDNQMSHFTIEVQENGSDEIISLTPVYDGLYNQEVEKYCYYQYINSNTIRIRFDPNSYQPRTNANVKIKLYTSQGASGNFEYTDDLTVRLTSDKYTNLYMIVKQRGNEGSYGGLDRKSVEELQKIIPKESLSRGSITTLSDLKNYFNSINNETSVLHAFRKEDNILTRIYYTYCLMKDINNNVVPTNTIPISIPNAKKYYLESGTPLYYYKNSYSTMDITKNNYLGWEDATAASNTIYTYDGDDISKPSFKSLQLKEGDIIQFSTSNLNVYIGEVISIIRKNSQISNISVVLEKTFEEENYRLPSSSDIDKSLGGSLQENDILWLKKIGFSYTNPLSMIVTEDPDIDSNRIGVSYYLDNINEERYLDFKCINSKSPLQFIASYVKVLRPSYLSSDRYNYTISIDLVPNIGSITEEMINRTRVVAVFYRDNTPAAYSIADYIGSNDMERDVMSYQIKLFTKPLNSETDGATIDDQNRLYIGNNYLNGYSESDYKLYEVTGDNGKERKILKSFYLDENVTMRIYTMYKYINDISVDDYQDDLSKRYKIQNTQFTDTGIALFNTIPKTTYFETAVLEDTDEEDYEPYYLNDMVLTNVYETHDGINLLYDYSNLMNSYVTKLSSGSIINRVPVVRYYYLNSEERINSFIKELKRKILYVTDALDPLECTFGLDFKFFNTYGPSNMYHISDLDGNISDLIDNVALTMTFRTKFYNENSDRDSILPLIKNDIKAYIEDLEDLSDLHFPNLTTEIESKYSDYIIYFEFMSFNSYDANHQHIITNENMELLTVVPEFLSVDNDNYTGLPRININVVS